MTEIATNTDIKFERGIIGFFDILGYQSFLQNNSAEEAAKEVLLTINSIHSKILEEFSSDAENNLAERYFEEHLDWLIFSDTILITTKNFNENSNLQRHWLIFIYVASLICQKMFEFGLPVRGAISYGDFIKQKNCFAGTPIVEAYKTTENLNIAACVLCDSATKLFDSLPPFTINQTHVIQNLLVKYFVPLKNKEELMFTIGFFTKGKNKDDIRQMVLDSFWKHNKDIPLSAHAKADNTEKFLRFLKSKRGS